MNTTSCSRCGRSLIAEEKLLHECRKVLDYKIEGTILWLFDGDMWYPRKLRHQPQGNTENNPRRGNST